MIVVQAPRSSNAFCKLLNFFSNRTLHTASTKGKCDVDVLAKHSQSHGVHEIALVNSTVRTFVFKMLCGRAFELCSFVRSAWWWVHPFLGEEMLHAIYFGRHESVGRSQLRRPSLSLTVAILWIRSLLARSTCRQSWSQSIHSLRGPLRQWVRQISRRPEKLPRSVTSA